MQRQPKARSTKSKSRLEAYEQLRQKVNAASNRAASGKGALTLEAQTRRLGGTIVSFEGASVDALSGAAVVRDFTYDFKRGDRVGMCAPSSPRRLECAARTVAKRPGASTGLASAVADGPQLTGVAVRSS